MKKLLVFSYAALMFAFMSVKVFAQIPTTIPQTISYQGYVTDQAKQPLTGTHQITVKFYDTPVEGTMLHSESFTSNLEGGIFSVVLGSQSSFEPVLDFRAGYWIGVSVDGNAELTPRTALTSVPYAINANHAETASGLSKNASGAITSLNGKSGDVSLVAGTGISLETIGKDIWINSTAGSGGASTQGNTSAAGTANQVLVNGTSGTQQSGALILSTPQDIHTGASPTFSGLTLSGMGVGVVHSSAGGLHSSSLVVNADVSNAAAIAYSKLALAGSIVNNDISNSAAIAYSKLALAGNIVNNDISNSAAIAYSKLNLSNNIMNSDINAGAAISDTKLATISTLGKVANSATTGTSSNVANTLVLRDASGNFTAGSITASTITVTGKVSSAATLSSDPSVCLTTKGYIDNIAAGLWSTTGNSGLSSSNFIGTSDAVNLSFGTNGSTRMQLMSDGSLLLAGNAGSVPASGSGTRMMWIPSLGAFRAGVAAGSEWNSGNVGQQSVAMGNGVLASGAQSVAMGYFSSAYGMGSTAIGSGCGAFYDGATAIGSACQANGFNSVAMGDNSAAEGIGSVAIGSNASAGGLFSTALGSYTSTLFDYGTAMGRNLSVGRSSFGFNGSTTGTTMNVSALNNIAYFGDVDVMIGNDDNNARSLRFYSKNNATTLTSAHYTSFKAGTMSSNVVYTLPTTQGASGSYLSNNGAGTLSWATQNAAYGSVTAGDEVDIPGNTNVVKIEDDGTSGSINLLVLPGGTNGQMMYIFNNDADATSGDATILSGTTGVFIYADGWRKTN
jgi:hypothetical protein